MNRQLLNLLRDVIEGAPKGTPPYDHYTYNSLAWQAVHFSHHAKTPEEKELCEFLRQIAVRKSNELRNPSQTHTENSHMHIDGNMEEA